jgi:hypothetical protein
MEENFGPRGLITRALTTNIPARIESALGFEWDDGRDL